MDEEHWSTNTTNLTILEDYAYMYEEMHPLKQTIFYIILSVIDITADGFIIYVISNYMQMKTIRNILVLNWAVSNILFNIFEPLKFTLIIFYIFKQTHSPIISVIYEIHALFQICTQLFIITLFTDCCYKKLTLVNLKNVVQIIWLLSLIIISSAIISRMCDSRVLNELCEMILFGTCSILFLSFLIKMVLYLIRRVRRKELKTHIRFILALSYICSWFVTALCHFISDFVSFRSHEYKVLMSVGKIFQILAYSNPVVQLVILYVFDGDFRANFRKLMASIRGRVLCEKRDRDTISTEEDAYVEERDMVFI